jgi:ParB family chromosome partitioning protein
MTLTIHLPVSEITFGHRRRAVNRAHVVDLAESIRTLGLLQPLVVTTGYMLVAGRHRLEAVKLLNWTTVPVLVADLTHLQAEVAVLDENLVRNDLSRLERFEHVVARADLIDALGQRRRTGRPRKSDTVSGLQKTTDEIAGVSGLSGRTLQRATKIVTAIPEDVRDELKGTVLADSTTELLRLSRLSRDDQRAVAKLVHSGMKGAVNDLVLAVKRQRRQEEATRQLRLQVVDEENIHVGRFEENSHVIEDGSVALFLADPPYADVAIYGQIGRLASEKLRPGGWVAAYCSTHLLGEVIRQLSENLAYFWTVAIRCSGASKQCNAFRVRSGWKAVLVFQKPPRVKPPDWINDFHVGSGAMKNHHHWEQPVEEAKYLIDRLTNPGDLVADVTCGSGSSLVAAKLAARKWVGIDADPEAVRVARLRLRECDEKVAVAK